MKKRGRKRNYGREEEFIRLYNSGMTMEEIADLHGISRQAVSQVLIRSGAVLAKRKTLGQIKKEEIEARLLKKRGMPDARYKELYRLGAVGKFWAQRKQAEVRGVDFEMNFAEWWNVWEKSGKWELRGRGVGQYVMARFGDVGPYRTDNVHIILASQNHVDCWEYRRNARSKLVDIPQVCD